MCEYCNDEKNNEALIDWYNTTQLEEKVFIKDDKLYLVRNKSFDDLRRMCVGTIQINYCPMCGRKLKHVNKDKV